MAGIQTRQEEIAKRIAQRQSEITHLLEPPEATQVELVPESDSQGELPGEERMEEIRRSVASDVDTSGAGAGPQGPPPPPSGSSGQHFNDQSRQAPQQRPGTVTEPEEGDRG
jgi:hypothetical protein